MLEPLTRPLSLPCGATIENRIAKTAMSEGMADLDHHSTPRLEALYQRWAQSGAGLLFSGNIQVDRDHLERPLNIVIEDDGGSEQLARLAAAGKSGGAHFWAQLSHPGRQVDAAINPAPLAPSAVEVDVIRGAGFNFAPPRAMDEAEIGRTIEQFAYAAAQVRDAGFTGVTLHAAHGYLISQFLSPLSNRREDRWGGSLENRSRFLIEAIRAVREAVGSDFPIGIKLNSSDFQKGGFTSAECVALVKVLNGTSLDLLEVSGGSLEQPKVMGITLKEEGEDGPRQSTIAREAYFVNFTKEIRDVATMPVMVDGGFRSAAAMIESLEKEELDLIGIGRPMIADPQGPKRLLSGEIDRLPSYETRFQIFHFLPWNNMQLERMGDGLAPDLSLDGEAAFNAFVELEANNLAALLMHRGMAGSAGSRK
ncbi:NADH:flavin oxidoreductase [Sphingobium sp. LB126]|uniref:NADH:flavin oxidoreductase/NADH oxidase family protein n=1 Tax=Sphingobium sp. LB126 TaxID=1983755 RepID=UPI000C20A065|nr:NADH:flavin oxidoreductase/NADH oxidase family protein [Sphingobium sp. LB126]PJG47128.1 NADH:flavin oxidoreductase [Sphingobium sp. LB126]